jgi:hypothetical protein
MQRPHSPSAGSIAIIVWIAASLPAPAAACPPSASLRGPEPEVGAVTAHLRADRVLVGDATCRTSAVEVTLARLAPKPGLSLHIRDAYGRVSERQVPDNRTAASVIESWVLDEDGDLIAPPGDPAPGASPPAIVASQAPQLPAPAMRWRATGALEVSAASDGSAWYGGQVTGCRVVGSTCIGGRARVSRDSGLGAASDAADIGRTAVELVLVTALPTWTGAVRITPLVGLGAGLTRTSDPSTLANHTVDREELELRAEGSIEATVPIGPRMALVGSVGAGWGRFAGRLSGPSMVTPNVPGAMLTYLRAGLGCEFGR